MNRRHTFGWIILGLLALFVIGSLLWGFSVATGHFPYFARPYPFFFFFPFGFLFFFLFIFFAVRLVFWGAWGWRGGYRTHYWTDANEVLRQRYARGEITKEQFDEMSRNLHEQEQSK